MLVGATSQKKVVVGGLNSRRQHRALDADTDLIISQIFRKLFSLLPPLGKSPIPTNQNKKKLKDCKKYNLYYRDALSRSGHHQSERSYVRDTIDRTSMGISRSWTGNRLITSNSRSS
jgi:hypothetical protein